jgi:uncharacterized membrane protein (UPF0127 family)
MDYKNKIVRVIFRKYLAVFIAGVCTSCAAADQAQARLETRDLFIETSAGKIPVTVELAVKPAEKEAGLMFRKTLAAGTGMLFVYDRDQVMTFWMKNTPLPLSIAFIAQDGRITEIRDMEPFSLSHVRSKRSVRYALEAPKGWFDLVGISAGDRLIM